MCLKVLDAFRKENSKEIPDDYEDLFEKAERTFLHQRVFDPITRTVVTLAPLTAEEQALADIEDKQIIALLKQHNEENLQDLENLDPGVLKIIRSYQFSCIGFPIEPSLARDICCLHRIDPITRKPYKCLTNNSTSNPKNQQQTLLSIVQNGAMNINCRTNQNCLNIFFIFLLFFFEFFTNFPFFQFN